MVLLASVDEAAWDHYSLKAYLDRGRVDVVILMQAFEGQLALELDILCDKKVMKEVEALMEMLYRSRDCCCD